MTPRNTRVLAVVVLVSMLFLSGYFFSTMFPLVERGVSTYDGYIVVSSDGVIESLVGSNNNVQLDNTTNTVSLSGTMILMLNADERSNNLSLATFLEWVNYHDNWTLESDVSASVMSLEVNKSWSHSGRYDWDGVFRHPQLRETLSFNNSQPTNYTLELKWDIRLHFFNLSLLEADYLLNFSIDLDFPYLRTRYQPAGVESTMITVSGAVACIIVFVLLAEYQTEEPEDECRTHDPADGITVWFSQ